MATTSSISSSYQKLGGRVEGPIIKISGTGAAGGPMFEEDPWEKIRKERAAASAELYRTAWGMQNEKTNQAMQQKLNQMKMAGKEGSPEYSWSKKIGDIYGKYPTIAI